MSAETILTPRPAAASIATMSARAQVAFWSRVDTTGDCWEWQGARDRKGYGWVNCKVDGAWRTFYTHRLAWLLLVGEIAPGLTLDHQCGNHACANPDHMHPETRSRNSALASPNGRARYCIRGHEFTPENTGEHERYGIVIRRQCRECDRQRKRAAYRKERA